MSTGGGHLQEYKASIRRTLLAIVLVNNIVLVGCWWLGEQYGTSAVIVAGATASLATILALLVAFVGGHYLSAPFQVLQQGILHISPNTQADYGKPAIEQLRVGRELVTTLLANVYQLAAVAETTAKITTEEQADLHHNFIANQLPLPLLVLNHDQTIIFANEAAQRYIQAPNGLDGQSLSTALNMAFATPFTLDSWLHEVAITKPTATQTWERVKSTRKKSGEETTSLFFDVAAFYNQNNTHGFETLIVLFDHTSVYSQDDQAMSLMALGVHELRTPLTLLRGYLEVFESELDASKLTPDLQGYLHKMDASTRQLTAFINNILKVARIDEDGFALTLREEAWPVIVESAIADMRVRAEVRGITLTSTVAADLPTIGADRTSLYEVLMNLIDNAIKYSADAKEIRISSYLTKDGLVETTVQDFGIGIPEGSIPNLFTKFYRNHRHRSTINGTGLGLYLAKTIVGAHSGNLWVRSKEGEGSVFGFTLQPYDQAVSSNAEPAGNGIIRTTHGWIKNHSMVRR